MNYSDMMGERTDYIKRLMEITRSQLGSQYSYEVLIEYPDEDAIKAPEVLKNMDVLTERIGTLSQTKVSNGKPRVSSVTKVIKEMNRTLNEDDPDFYVILTSLRAAWITLTCSRLAQFCVSLKSSAKLLSS